MAEEVVVLHSGFITKRGQLVKSWKRRYFSLNKSGLLEYFDGRRCKGRLSLSLTSVIKKKTSCPSSVLWPSAATDETAISIDLTTKQMYLVFDTAEDCRQWVAALSPFVTLGSTFQAINHLEQTNGSNDHGFLRSANSTEEEEVSMFLTSLSVKIPRTSIEELAGTLAVQRVVDCMNKFPEVAKVQCPGCKCLYRLAAKSRRLLKHCVQHNALGVATNAMKDHYTEEEVQLSGIHLIQCYLEKDDPQIHNQVLDEIYVRRICQALKVLGRRIGIVEAALASLWLMATTCPFEWSCPSFINAGVFPTLIDVLSNDCPLHDVVESAFCIVTAMMPYDSMPEVFVHCGGLHALLSVLQLYSRQPTTVLQCLRLVFHLVCKSGKARAELLEQHLIEHLLPFLLSSGHALQHHVSDVQSATLAVLSTIAEQDPSWLSELSGDVVTACIEVAQTSGDDISVLEASLRFLQFALHSGAVEEGRSREVTSFLLGFLSSHCDNAVILSYAIAALAKLVTTDCEGAVASVLDLLKSEVFVENLSVAMKSFLGNVRIQSNGCLILCEAVAYARERILYCGGFELLCNALQTHPKSKPVACAALLGLERLVTSATDESLVQFFEAGGFIALVSGMQHWPKSETVQTSALRIFTHLVLKDRRISEAVTLNGYLSLVVASMRHHQGIIAVQMEACCCLNAIANYDLAIYIHRSEACRYILEAMLIEGYHDNVKLQFNALSLLSILLSFVEDWSECLDPELCLSAVLSALCHFTCEESFQLPAFAALLALGRISELQREKIASSEVGVQNLCEAAMAAEWNPALQLRARDLHLLLTSDNKQLT